MEMNRSSRGDKQLAVLSVLLFLLATFCFTHGSPAVRRTIIRKSLPVTDPATFTTTGCESAELAIQMIEEEAKNKVYTGHRWIDKTMLFELTHKSVKYNNGELHSHWIRNENATCIKTINTSYNSCARSEDYTAMNLHRLVENRPYLLLWHFPLPAQQCMKLVIKSTGYHSSRNKLYYLRNKTKENIQITTGSKTIETIYNHSDNREIVTMAFHSETGADPGFELYFRHMTDVSNCKCKKT